MLGLIDFINQVLNDGLIDFVSILVFLGTVFKTPIFWVHDFVSILC
jgi:hypothetical protein